MTGTGGLVRTIGLRHLVERRLRTALTVGGIAAGVALVFSIMAMNAALNRSIDATVQAFDGPAGLQATAVAAGAIDAAAVDRIRAVDGVTTAAPILQARTEIDGEAAFVLGATPELLAFSPGAAPVDAPPGAAAAGIVLGERLAGGLDVDVGETVSVGTPTGPVDLAVGAVLPAGPVDRINSGRVAVLPLAVAQQHFQRPDQLDLVLIDGSADGTAVQQAVGGAAIVTAPGDAPGDRSENVQPFLLLSNAIGLIALFVALVLVFNAMSMAMAERRRELALAAALGARRRQLFVGILGEAAVVGAIGTAAGLAGGALLADQLLRSAGASLRVVLPVDPPTGAVLVGPHLLVAAVTGVAVAVLGAVVPARRVLRAAPIAALRPASDYEWLPDADRRARLIPIGVGGGLLAAGIGVGSGLSGPVSFGQAGLIAMAILGGITVLLPVALPLVTDRIGRLLEQGWGVHGRLAGDALRANPRRTSITLATLILPLATVIGLGTAFSSAQARFHATAETYYGSPLAVLADDFVGYTAFQPLPLSVGADLEAVPGVRAALPENNLVLTTDDGLAIVYAIPQAQATRDGVADVLDYDRNAEHPSAFRAGLVAGEVAVSRLAARNRGLDVGDTVTLPTGHGPTDFRVASVFDDLAGVDTFYLDWDEAARHWPVTGSIGFGIVLDDGADVVAVHAALDAFVAERRLPADVLDRDAAVAHLEAGLTGLFSVARVIQLAAVVVAGLSLMSTAFTTILERRWSLGLQRALGMSRRQIARSLALEAAAVAVIGGLVATVVGIAIGVLMSQSFGLVSGATLPLTIPWPVVVACAGGAVVLSLLATAYPRQVAIRTRIIDALAAE